MASGFTAFGAESEIKRIDAGLVIDRNKFCSNSIIATFNDKKFNYCLKNTNKHTG